MIKINLLGVAKPSAARAVGPPPTLGRQLTILGCALLAGLLVAGFFYKYWSAAINGLENDLRKERAEQTRLAAIQAENLKYLQRRNELEQRINTIQTLQNSRVGPVELMNALGTTVDKTSDLYLLTVGREGSRLVIKGQSDTVHSIARFITALKTSPVFEDVQLRQYYQDDQHGRTSFKFNVDCIYKIPEAASNDSGPAPQPGSATRAPARRAGV
ncbi:MAG TPA: PilN domain-containing protein [Terriglobia bacterium]|jgi:Tfp pilus assembly protein PilN|nr:PilN domain-containing protein [Terriglobia bacterium]